MSEGRSMTEHKRISDLLPLAAAGVLDQAEEARLSAHLRLCQDCASNLNFWQQVQADLRRIPTPQVAGGVVERTIALAQNRVAQESNRRTERRIVALVLVFSWAFVAVSWPLAQLLGHGWQSLLGFGFEQGWKNFAVFTAICWLAAGAAAILLAIRRERERRLA